MSQKPPAAAAACIYLKYLNDVGIRESSIGQCHSINLTPERPYTIGRWNQCDIVFSDRRVSKKHCQLFFNRLRRKIYILDGELVVSGGSNDCTVTSGLRDRLCLPDSVVEPLWVKASINGVFINGVRIRKGVAAELSVGDEVRLVCADIGICTSNIRIGFVIQRIVLDENVVHMSEVDLGSPLRLLETASSAGRSHGSASSGRNKRVFALREVGEYQCCAYPQSRHDRLIQQARLLSNKCRHILNSDDPVSCLRLSPISICMPASFRRMTNCSTSGLQPKLGHGDRNVMNCPQLRGNEVFEIDFGISSENVAACGKLQTMQSIASIKPLAAQLDDDLQERVNCESAGRKIFLNHLNVSSSSRSVVSLKDLLHPVGSIVRIFITTFTSDVLWFLSYCEIPSHLPVTVACHNTERCWSSSPDKRTSKPFPDFPNLELVFPQFPEAIAFGKDRKKQGIACHHPKLLVLQREESMRIVITSANLVAKQWCTVTNTVWWQDFPCANTPDYSTLFSQNFPDDSDKKIRSDFSAQLAGFMAALLVDVPSQAHWIAELSKYDFGGASGYLVVSLPGIHSDKLSFVPESMNFLLASKYSSLPFGEHFLGSVEVSVVGLSHLFHTAADSNGRHLKRLAAFLGNFQVTAFGMLEIALKRNKDVPVDPNAVSVFVSDGSLDSECIQLGFLPRDVAKWVSPLWDMGLFRFYGYILSEEALAAALGETKKKIKMILHVCKGPCFSDIPKMVQPMNSSALCSLIAAVHRRVGLWRLKEVLGQYIWPECQETDFIYCSSSIGSSMNAPFLAAFSAATGKRSVQSFDSEESDPEWGCWSASQEKQSPSVQIIFPTIDRVKNASCGILPSIRMLCFSEKTWNRMKDMNMLCDAVPNPPERVGYPMHVKVARRRFQPNMGAPSYGWVYSGSHNFSSAAWGRPISNPDNIITNGPNKRSTFGPMLHVCNYELGIVFIVPPPDVKDNISAYTDLDDIILPFVAPAPKYKPRDRPATKQAMKEAFAKLSQQNTVDLVKLGETADDIPDEEEEFVEATCFNDEEKEEEKAYAESLWSQVDSNSTLGAETLYTRR